MVLTSNKPKVSIILPTYNCSHLLERAVKSVLEQTYRNFELFVIDDDSNDNTEYVIEKYSDDRIIYIKNDKNIGPGPSRNVAIEKSNGEFITFLDSDDIWYTNKLEKQIEFILKYPREEIIWVGDNYTMDKAGWESVNKNLRYIRSKMDSGIELKVFLWNDKYKNFKDLSRIDFDLDLEDIRLHCEPYGGIHDLKMKILKDLF